MRGTRLGALETLIISWPTNLSDVTLVSSQSLSAGATWKAVGTIPVISGPNYQVIIPGTNTAQLFRLHK